MTTERSGTEQSGTEVNYNLALVELEKMEKVYKAFSEVRNSIQAIASIKQASTELETMIAKQKRILENLNSQILLQETAWKEKLTKLEIQYNDKLNVEVDLNATIKLKKEQLVTLDSKVIEAKAAINALFGKIN